MSKIKKISICFLLSIIGCGGTSSDEEDTAVVVGTNGTPAFGGAEDIYFDSSPTLNEAGSKMVFISGRLGVSKAYKFNRGISTKPVRLTAEDLGAELEAKISPDGQWVALKVLPLTGNLQLFIQSFDDPTKRIDISGTDTFFSDFSFSSDSPPRLLYLATESTNGKSLKVARFLIDDDASTPLPMETLLASDFNQQETLPVWANQAERIGIFTRLAGILKSTFIFRSFDGTAIGSATENGETENLGELGPVPGQMGFLFSRQILNDVESVVPESDRVTEIKKVYLKNQPLVSGFDGATQTPIPLKQYFINKIAVARVGQLAVFLGKEIFSCEAGGENDFFGVTLIFFDGSVQTKVLLQNNGDLGYIAITSEYCSAFNRDIAINQQPVDFKVTDFELARDFSSGIFNIVFQTSFQGDSEIFHMTGPLTGAGLGDIIFTNISNNQNPQ